MTQTDRTVIFDDAVEEILRNIKGVRYYESVAENTDAPLYVVHHRNSEVGAINPRDRAVVGHQDDWYMHPFFIEVWGDDSKSVRKVSSYIKQKLIGATLCSGSSGINVVTSASSRPDYDASMRPVKHTQYLSFTVRLDRSSQ